MLLQIRSQSAGNRRLLLSASPNHPRLHYTEARWENPAQPPMFCMLLRKHLAGGRIVSLRQLPLERAVELCAETDYRMKSSGADARELLKEAVLRIAAGECHAED